jgi:signal transduction histidine kinase
MILVALAGWGLPVLATAVALLHWYGPRWPNDTATTLALLAALVAAWGRPGGRIVARATSDAARSERLRMLRLMHDTALQCLEAMSRQSTSDNVDPAAAIVQLRADARAEATRLRTALGQAGHDPGGLAAGLGDVVADAIGRGLRVELVVADLDGVSPTPARRAALCGATAAALSNVWRHSGVTRAVVRLDRTDAGLRVVVRDHGRGFAVDGTGFGFGISESILARIDEVGGRAGVRAAPGTGTRVTMWVPV